MKSLTSRLTLWYALVVTLTVAVILFIGRWYMEHNLIEGIDLLNEVEFEEIRSRIDEEAIGDGREALIEAIGRHAEMDAALYYFQVGANHDTILYRSSNLGRHELPEGVHGRARASVYDSELGHLRSAEFDYAGLDIHIASSLDSAEILFKDFKWVMLYVCSGVFLLSLVFGYGLSRVALHPIAAIQRTAQRISVSRFGERIPVPQTSDEVARMARFLNEMLDRLERSYTEVKRFTAEASHEFRTPLSIIRLHCERLLANPGLPEEERQAALGEQMEEVARLNKLIDDLLVLAKADAGVMPLQVRQVDLEAYLQDFRDDADLLAEERGVRFELDRTGDADGFFDPSWMRHVLLNLLSNALNISAPGQTIRLEVEAAGGAVCLRMVDEGPGLAEEQLERIFNRFERAGKASETMGNGLGLAICQSIVKCHGGSIRALNRTDRSGLILEVRLDPAAGKGGL